MQSLLRAPARFCGTTVSLSPRTITTWNATATLAQLVQLVKAYASLVLRTGFSSVTQTREMATSYSTVPSTVLTASAWLSPGPGASGSENGKTHPASGSAP